MQQDNSSLVSDQQWQAIRPILNHAPRAKVGRKPADNRQVLEAFLWVVRHGSRWQDLPAEFPSARTCQRRLQRWRTKGLWPQVWRAYLANLDHAGQADWARAFIEIGADEAAVNDQTGAGRVGRPPWWLELARTFWQMARQGQLPGALEQLSSSKPADQGEQGASAGSQVTDPNSAPGTNTSGQPDRADPWNPTAQIHIQPPRSTRSAMPPVDLVNTRRTGSD
jgi:transposase